MILLVTGGSASGKSEYAENRALQLAEAEQRKLIYLATMRPFGEDASKRIERHRRLRAGKGFETVERYTDIEGLCHSKSLDSSESESSNEETFRKKAKGAVVMLECMSNLTANEMFSNMDDENLEGESEKNESAEAKYNIAKVRERILRGIDALEQIAGHLVIVSINVFDEGLQQYDPWTQAYIQCLGGLNQELTRKADEAVEVVYSIPVPYKEDESCSL